MVQGVKRYEAKHSYLIYRRANAGELRCRTTRTGDDYKDNYNRGRYDRAHGRTGYPRSSGYPSSSGCPSGRKDYISRDKLCLDNGILALDRLSLCLGSRQLDRPAAAGCGMGRGPLDKNIQRMGFRARPLAIIKVSQLGSLLI